MQKENYSLIPSKNIPAIPAESRQNYVSDLPGLVWNSRGILGGFQVESAGIRRKSGPKFRRNYCRHSPGIPPEIRAGILLELLPAFPQYSTVIILGWNSARIIADIFPFYFHQNSGGVITDIVPVFKRK